MARRALPLLLFLLLAAAAGWWVVQPARGPGGAPDAAGRAAAEEAAEPTFLVGRRPEAPETTRTQVTPPPVAHSEPAVAPGYEGFAPPVRYELFDAETGLSIPTPEGMLTEVEVAQEMGPWYGGCGWVVPVPGYVLFDGSAWSTDVVYEAREARAIVPLRREVRVTVRLDLARDGGPADELLVFWSLASFQADPRVFRPVPDEVALEGVPFLRGETLKVFAARRRGTSDAGVTGLYGMAEVPLPEDPRASLEVVVAVPPLPEESEAGESWSIEESEVVDHNEPDEETPRPEERPTGRGDVLVRARRWGGAPVPTGTLLHLGTWGARTDPGGMARFEGVYAGARRLTMRGLGMVPISKDVTVVAGTTTSVDLDEPVGASIDLSVVDGDGRSLPAARIRLRQPSGVPWTEVHDGVQRIDPFTDFRGRRLLSRVEPGKVVVEASYGSRRASEVVEVGDGETRGVRIVLR